LKPGDRSIELKGLNGIVVGRESRPVEVCWWDGRKAVGTFVVVKGDIPIVIGRNHLQPMGLLDVFVAMNDEQMLWVEEHDVVKEREAPNVVSGVDESKSDDELVAAARKVVRAQASHLDEETFEKL
jgi:hypothetical protein